jgi:hypothetical protein
MKQKQERKRRNSMQRAAPAFFWAAKICSLLAICQERPGNKEVR